MKVLPVMPKVVNTAKKAVKKVSKPSVAAQPLVAHKPAAKPNASIASAIKKVANMVKHK